jgi:hypothetical protein
MQTQTTVQLIKRTLGTHAMALRLFRKGKLVTTRVLAFVTISLMSEIVMSTAQSFFPVCGNTIAAKCHYFRRFHQQRQQQQQQQQQQQHSFWFTPLTVSFLALPPSSFSRPISSFRLVTQVRLPLPGNAQMPDRLILTKELKTQKSNILKLKLNHVSKYDSK